MDDTKINRYFKGGKIKLNFALDGAKIRILIEHCQDLPTISNTAPEPYVKTYLLDAAKSKISNSKVRNWFFLLFAPILKHIKKQKKTPTSHRTCHPTFNHVIEYHHVELEQVSYIDISVWSYFISGNVALGRFLLELDKKHLRGWFPLESIT